MPLGLVIQEPPVILGLFCASGYQYLTSYLYPIISCHLTSTLYSREKSPAPYSSSALYMNSSHTCHMRAIPLASPPHGFLGVVM